jgi:crotonobetainyl-CoA:carnitine CoA-transferase CaiB-like acyl-CoA transferase
LTEPALSRIRILAFELAAAGPFATHLLADMGAEVIKIERPGTGDTIRAWDSAVHGLSSGFVWLNRRKRSVAIDVSTPAGQEVMCRLAARSDVFLTNFGPGVAERMGLGYEELSRINPRLVYCALTGYGLDGPYREEKAFDLLIQGEAGIITSTGYPDAPAKVSVPISDLTAGMYAALGIMIALYQRERTGRGQLIDVSMFESVLSWLGYFPQHYWHQGEEPERVGMRHHFMVPYGPYLAKDGKYVNVACATGRNWEVFCEQVIERPELLADPRFASTTLRRTHRVDLERIVEEEFRTRNAADWLGRLRAARVPCGEVRGMAEVLAHPQVAARRLIRVIDSPVGPLPTIEAAFRLSDSPVATGPLPDLGGDTDAVLRDVGYSDEELAELRSAGVI